MGMATAFNGGLQRSAAVDFDLSDWQLATLLADADVDVRLAAERALFTGDELERQHYRAWCAQVVARRIAARPVVVQPEPEWSPYARRSA